MPMKPGVTGDAFFPPGGRCRMWLTRAWAPERGFALFAGLNPSKAGRDVDDMTVTKGMGFANRWELGGTLHVNAYPFIATNPADLAQCTPDEIKENDHWVLEMAKKAKVVVAAWGAFPKHTRRFKALAKLLSRFKPVCLGMTEDGFPNHISRIGYDRPRAPFKVELGLDDYRCQYCEAVTPKTDWQGDKCPICGGVYNAILAQEGDD